MGKPALYAWFPWVSSTCWSSGNSSSPSFEKTQKKLGLKKKIPRKHLAQLQMVYYVGKMLYNYFLGNSTYIPAGEVQHRQVQVLMHWTKLVQLLMHTRGCLISYNSKRTKDQDRSALSGD